MVKGNGVLLNVPITFGAPSIGKKSVSFGVNISSAVVNPERMRELFVNRQLRANLRTGDHEAPPLAGMEDNDVHLDGTFTANSYSEKPAGFSTRLAIAKSAVRPEDVWDLNGLAGRLVVTAVEEPTEKGHPPKEGQAELPHPDVEAGKDKPHTGTSLAAVAELRKQPIPGGRDGMTKPQRQLLEAANVTTMGELSDLLAKGPERAAAILGLGLPETEAILERAKGLLTHPPALEAEPTPPKTVAQAVPDMDAAETVAVPIDAGHKHDAEVIVAPLPGGWFSAGWAWWGEGDAGEERDAEVGRLIRQNRQLAVSAAAGQLVDSIQRADAPKSKAAQERRRKAIAACQTFYGECERGGQTIFEVAGK